MGQPASSSGSSTVFCGDRILAVSAIKWTPQKTITSASDPAALRTQTQGNLQYNQQHPGLPDVDSSIGQDHMALSYFFSFAICSSKLLLIPTPLQSQTQNRCDSNSKRVKESNSTLSIPFNSAIPSHFVVGSKLRLNETVPPKSKVQNFTEDQVDGLSFEASEVGSEAKTKKLGDHSTSMPCSTGLSGAKRARRNVKWKGAKTPHRPNHTKADRGQEKREGTLWEPIRSRLCSCKQSANITEKQEYCSLSVPAYLSKKISPFTRHKNNQWVLRRLSGTL